LALVETVCEERPGLRERQRQARDEAILEAAFALLVEQGYDGLTMEALAERVGVSRQTLYHHFTCKEDIALRALLTLMEKGIRSIESIDPSLPPLTRLEQVVRWMLEVRFSPGAAAFVRAKPSIMPLKARPEYHRAFERRAHAIEKIVVSAQDAGAIRQDLPAAMIVQILLSLVSGEHYEDVIASGQIGQQEATEAIAPTLVSGIRS